MTKRTYKNRIDGLKADKMLTRIESVRTEIDTAEDPWWGKRTTTYTFVTIDGIEYEKTSDRDGWAVLWELKKD